MIQNHESLSFARSPHQENNNLLKDLFYKGADGNFYRNIKDLNYTKRKWEKTFLRKKPKDDEIAKYLWTKKDLNIEEKGNPSSAVAPDNLNNVNPPPTTVPDPK